MHKIFGIRKMLAVLVLTGISLPALAKPNTAQKKFPAAAKPNIIIIMADDLGFSDLGCYGSEIRTPNLDKLAKNGLRFTQFYNTARCCPSRASLLTGQYPHQAGIGRMTMNQNLPGYQGYLTKNTVTIAEVLKQAGYQTGMTGKWHVSETKELPKQKQLQWLAHQADYGNFSDTATYPTARGFDKYYGTIWGVVDYFDPFSLVNGAKPVKTVPPKFYYTDALGDTSAAYVKQFAKKQQPFFLYIAHTAPHWPLQALPEDIAKYENYYKAGWEPIRKRRYQNLLQMGMIKQSSVALSPRLFPERDWTTNPHQVYDARAMAVHAAMIDRMDQNIGKLVQALKQTGELENTIIFFMSDNGASYEIPSEYGPGFDRAASTRQGQKVDFSVDKNLNALPGPQTVHAGIGPQWANVANTPFRYYKAKLHEGGITTPFFINWPAGLKTKGQINEQPGHIMDVMATCLELAGTAYPKEFRGNVISPLQGKSLVPFINGNKQPIHQELYWEHFGAKAVRHGDWKLVKLDEKSPWELYNLKTDRSEIINLAEKHPDKVQKLSTLWNNWAGKTQVIPAPK